MARQLRIQYPGAFYHITCRGNQHRKIYLDEKDRLNFIKLLKESLETYQVILYGYVLMDNHFHLIIQTLRANLSEFMRHFNICYTGWFNYWHNTCGHLYQGRYKALLIDAQSYLLELSRYVHLNPVRTKEFNNLQYNEKSRFLMEYKWSSLLGYVDSSHKVDFIDYNLILEEVGGRYAYQQFIYDGLKNGVKSIGESIKFQVILGDDDFIANIRAKYLIAGSAHAPLMYQKMTAKVLDPELVIKICSEVLDITPEQLKIRSGDGVKRGIVALMLYKYCGINQREIAEVLGGVSNTAVNMLIKRLKERLKYPEIKNQFVNIEERLRKICEL